MLVHLSPSLFLPPASGVFVMQRSGFPICRRLFGSHACVRYQTDGASLVAYR